MGKKNCTPCRLEEVTLEKGEATRRRGSFEQKTRGDKAIASLSFRAVRRNGARRRYGEEKEGDDE